MKRLTIALAALLLTIPAHAQVEAQLFFSRAQIAVVRAQPPAIAPEFPWQEASTENPRLPFNVEIRDGTTLFNQQGWYNLSAPQERSGVMMVFPAPQIVPIVSSTQYAPLDILLIDKEGTITQIVPNLALSTLEEDIYPAKPALAMLFVKGGTCAKLSIQPGDAIDYKLFRKPPPVLSAAPEKPAPAPAPALAPAVQNPVAKPVQAAPVPEIRVLQMPRRQ